MGSSASVDHGAGAATPHGNRGGGTPSPGPIQSTASSAQTDGRGGNDTWGGQSFRSNTPVLNRAKSRQALAKKLAKGRILFLGLDGAGKTTLVQQLLSFGSFDDGLNDDTTEDQPGSARPSSPLHMLQPSSSTGDLLAQDGTRIPRVFPNPTRATGYSTYRLDMDRYVQLIDVPGRRAYRNAHWRAAFGGDPSLAPATAGTTASSALPIVGVVFVVDATDFTRFPLVARELVALQKLKDARLANGTSSLLATWLQRAPFLLVLNKVDAAASGNVSINSPERRQASRTMRQELKSAFDHQLRMDQKKHPSDYMTTQSGAAPSGANSSGSASKKRAALAEANSNRKTLLMTSLVECCAFDHDCVRALHVLLRDEIRRLWSGAP